MDAESNFVNPFGSYSLTRGRVDRTGTLRAWDGADYLLLDHAHALALGAHARVLVVGENFGALSVSLAAWSPAVWTDSVVAEHAIGHNHERNGLTAPRLIPSTERNLVAAIGGPVDVIVWNLPRATEMISHIAGLLASISHPRTVVLAAGMDKHLPPRTAEILRSLGHVTTHPGKRKAHLFSVTVPAGSENFASPGITSDTVVKIPEHKLSLVSAAGVFSADRFDLGTRLLSSEVAARLPHLRNVHDVVDLGCGNGAVGIVAMQAVPEASVFFLDESRLAISSAQHNVSSNVPASAGNAQFVCADIFGRDWSTPLDLALCNPPFHHANAMSDEVAWQMFVESHRYLRPGGQLWVVGNRHLAYHAKLKRIFGNVQTLSSHPKFVVLAATR